MGKKEILGLLPDEIHAELSPLGQPGFRAKQIFKWLHRGVASFDEMTDLPAGLRAALDENYTITVPDMMSKQTSRDGTVKYLWGFHDGQSVESVFMRYHHGNTVCLSTQAGCRMGCTFCASSLGGLVRNLSAAEMMAELLAAERDNAMGKSAVHGFVLMGTGEPLDNMENVLKFLALSSHPEGLNIGLRHVSLSSCGMCDKIRELAEKKLQLTLSISLHAPTDEKRDVIMPVNRAYPIATLMKTCRDYFNITGRRISFEYAMIRDFNDSHEDALALAQLLRGMSAHVNMIPLNEIAESLYKPSSRETMEAFLQTLTDNGVTATIRRRLGADISAACGQLRRGAGKYNQTR